ncbi:unnamed protein product [Effrenium voratum]|nr:unnamed protein product [Effrenium voratum]
MSAARELNDALSVALSSSSIEWAVNVQICDLVKENQYLAPLAMSRVDEHLRKESARAVQLALSLLEMLIKNCGLLACRAVTAGMAEALVAIVKKRESWRYGFGRNLHKSGFSDWLPQGVAIGEDKREQWRMASQKVLEIMQLCVDAFLQHEGSMRPIFNAYKQLRQEGYQFPRSATGVAADLCLVNGAEDSPAYLAGATSSLSAPRSAPTASASWAEGRAEGRAEAEREKAEEEIVRMVAARADASERVEVLVQALEQGSDFDPAELEELITLVEDISEVLRGLGVESDEAPAANVGASEKCSKQLEPAATDSAGTGPGHGGTPKKKASGLLESMGVVHAIDDRPEALEASSHAVMALVATPEEDEALAALRAAQEDLLVGKHLGRQWDATLTLGQLEESAPSAAEVLSEALARTDLDAGIRWGAAESIAHLGQAAGNKAAFALAKALLQRKPGQVASDTFVRTGLAQCLGAMGAAARGSGAVALAKALQDDRDAKVRRRTAVALGQLGSFAGWAPRNWRPGNHGASALARALQIDKDLQVRCRCAEALGCVNAGEEGAKSLIKALAEDSDTDVRWRAAMSLGKLGPVADKGGAEALLKAQSHHVLAIRDHALAAAQRAVERCLETLDESVHPYTRGQACWFLGFVGPAAVPQGVEALAQLLLRPGEEVYLRRRAVEALGQQGGALTVLALKRAMEEDPDVYIQWHASEAYQKLPKSLQDSAEAEAAEMLQELLMKDVVRQQQIKKTRVSLPSWEPVLEAEPERPASQGPQLPSAAVGRISPKSPSSPMLPPKLEEVFANSPTLSPEHHIEPEAEILQGFLDETRSREVFRNLQDGGEIARQDLIAALKMMGHEVINNEWVNAIVKDKFSDRNFLDAYDFSKFLQEYEACHMNYVRMKFAEADTDGSGRVDAAELAEVLRRAGLTPVTGVVESLIAELCGRAKEVTFSNFAKILGVLRYRLGFTLQEFSEILTAFRRQDREHREALSLPEARGCLDWLGFDVSEDDLQQCSAEALQANSRKIAENEEVLLKEFDVVRLVRVVREYEGNIVAARLREMAGTDSQEPKICAATELPQLLSDLKVTLASPDVVMEAMQALGIDKQQLTIEDVMPVMWQIRRCQGLSQAELELAKRQFEICDEDNSGGMACCELEFAIRSLGYPVTYEEVQEQLDEWDMDESGEIEFPEFLKIISFHKRKELQRVLQAMFSGELQEKAPRVRRLSKAHQLNRKQAELPAVLLSSGHCPLREDSAVLKDCGVESPGSETELNLWGFAQLIAEYRRETNEEVRQQQGFMAEELEQLKQIFRSYDPQERGVIEKSQLRRLLLQQCPQAEQTQAGREQIAQIVKASDADHSGTIDFQEFILLMRLVSNRCSREKLVKERAAVMDTRFSVRELKEFRSVFKAFGAQGGELAYPELQKMLATIMRAAEGDRGSRELQQIVQQYDSNQDGSVDFPEFLRVMRHLLTSNWENINMHAEVAATAPPPPPPEDDEHGTT